MEASGKTMGGLGAAVKLVVRTFLEQEHYQNLHKHLAEEWSHCHSLTAAVRLMEAHGVHVSPDEEQRLAQLPEDRMIDALVMRMPQQSREQFEHFFLQLSLIASTTTRLRAALETGDSSAVEEVLDSAENVGILQFILKMAVAQAGQEVMAHEQDHDQWINVTDARMSPLLQSQANAMISQKALAQAKADLGQVRCTANEKTKQVLMSLAGGSAEALKATSFNSWADLVKHQKRENEIRAEYEEEINQAEGRLQDYILQQTNIMRNMINKKHANTTEGLLGACLEGFKQNVQEAKDLIQKAEEMKELEGKLSAFSKDQAAKSKKVLSRMNADSDGGLIQFIWNAWIQFYEDYKKNAEFEDAVKAEEKKIAEFMKKQNEGAKSVLNRMSSATDSGLIQACFQGWVEEFQEQKKAMEFEHMMASGSGRFNEFSSRNKSSAKGCMDRAAEATDNASLIIIFWHWKREYKVQRMVRYARDKNAKKKNQLIGVKGLFKNFANELEAGLKDGTPRVSSQSPTKKRSGRSASGAPSPKELPA